ncbi:hypothetical protein HY485_03990 [Candidatus Woesearchaeota archaeon]|nr:hypothetical protein [Candidatus Woesearchaeota archaeon]
MADKQIYFDIDISDATKPKGVYLFFAAGENYALISRPTPHAHSELYTSFKEHAEQNCTPELMPFTPVTKERICGAGLYRIDEHAKTITFFGKSSNPTLHTKPIGPIEQFADEILRKTGLTVHTYKSDNWADMWLGNKL